MQTYRLSKRYILAATVVLLLAVTTVAVVLQKKAATCVRYHSGSQKYVVWGGGEWHHVVDIYVGNPSGIWKIVSVPLPSTIKGPVNGSYIRLSYRWPSNWWDPYPASWWCIDMTSR
jgi:hypothetical protein